MPPTEQPVESGDPRLRTPQVVDEASDLAGYLLQANPERLRHSEAVARRAEFLTLAVDDQDAPLLVAAAWLHDIGYTGELRQTGFHPLDGALHLQRLGWSPRVCGLVAHHSGARYVAAVRRLDVQLDVFPHSEDALSDALTVADQTAGPGGTPMTMSERLEDMLSRHGPDSPNALAHAERRPYLVTAGARVADRLRRRGIGADQHRIF